MPSPAAFDLADWRAPEMPVRRLLVSVAGGENARFVESAAYDLEADGHAVCVQAARQGERGLTAHVERGGVTKAGRQSLWIATGRLDILNRPVGCTQHGHHQHVDRRQQLDEYDNHPLAAALKHRKLDDRETVAHVDQTRKH